MSELTIAVLGRNEGSRFLPGALRVWSSFADRIVFLDDSSTDNTKQLAKDAGALVFDVGSAAPMWGNESPVRRQLFDLACEFTPHDGFILFLDCDMIPARDPRPLMDGTSSGWAMPLWDLWGEKNGRPLYRSDEYWYGHSAPRVWMIRNPGPGDYVWNDRGIHCGHLPANLQFPRGVAVAPQDFGLLHYGWAFDDYRKQKVERYLSVNDQLATHEARHTLSALDPDPKIYPLPFVPTYRLERELPAIEVAA